ncbi:hemoblobin-interacting domain-containing protein [Metabacillus fastidiosus]|uniref:hemoblobin-interacting domain-containing protein n=1 Tax=Metabacillus fastidiosus TaxID=1458 RepID=UPI003D27E89D
MIPDTIDNFMPNLFEITFMDNVDWRMNITSIEFSLDGGTIFNSLPPVIGSGTLTIPSFIPVGTIIVKVKSMGYQDAIVTQEILNPASVTKIKSKDNSVVQVNDLTGFISVKASVTVDEIKSAIESFNGTNQSYKFSYNVGDDNYEYLNGSTISNIYVSWVDVLAEDGSTKGQYIIDFIN